ncbi:NAD(P)H-quinone oxidoreductase [Notoacmeibacter sp. MSK16QG-6]|uniref:NAD(P)H-quinone oxidoreductase n=1 Tax=Notoacmeibacter sp. MSK16QG-6 TaxID=2957982 RepID=UPI00209E22AF|nr:NAD(P)H-quinone oxidoreductase [Notoacmeibacter sp. MSK16QG-6]MCP1198817.1 NAD(P)H-quinone oxidoreductase [Notoacmeibacter sp. MSK16QG-6]
MADLPQDMAAVEITEPGGPDVLQPVRRPLPTLRADEVLLAVEAAGVNRPDVFQRKGLYPPPEDASDLPGLEVSGRVAKLGDDVTGLNVGDVVCALTPGGGYAEYVAVPAGHCLPVPSGLSMTEGAALPETVFTVWHNVFQRGALKEGETFLVHGGTSGIGTIAIQLAKALGARPFATAGSPEKCRAAEELGAEKCVDYKQEDFVDVLRDMTGGKGVDLILDMVGGDYAPRNHRLAALDGRIVQIATLGGPKQEVDLSVIMRKRLTHTGSTLRPRSNAFKTALAEELRQKVWPLIEDGKVRPLIDKTFPLADAAGAHRHMESSDHIGKIVLTVSS